MQRLDNGGSSYYSVGDAIKVGYGACRILRGGTISTVDPTMNRATSQAYDAAYGLKIG